MPQQGLQHDLLLVRKELRNTAQAILLVGDIRLKDEASVNFESSKER